MKDWCLIAHNFSHRDLLIPASQSVKVVFPEYKLALAFLTGKFIVVLLTTTCTLILDQPINNLTVIMEQWTSDSNLSLKSIEILEEHPMGWMV